MKSKLKNLLGDKIEIGH